MDDLVVNQNVIDVLCRHHAIKRDNDSRPIIIFSCGGEDKYHPARNQLREYVERNKNRRLQNIFFLKAETIAQEDAFSDLDLLTKEALFADIADWLVIFAESVGTFCELGAFAALPHSVSITSVVVDQQYKNSSSFLLNGPVKVIESCNAELSKVFYSDLNCPLMNKDFEKTLLNIRNLVKENENFYLNRRRKIITKSVQKPNSEPSKKYTKDKTKSNSRTDIQVGSFAHEMLDLIALFQPIDESSLVSLYLKVKGIENVAKLRLVSQTLSNDMKKTTVIKPAHVLAIMHSTGMIGKLECDQSSESLYYSKVKLVNYFMFRRTDEKDFNEMRASVLLKRRRRSRNYAENFYCRFDAK